MTIDEAAVVLHLHIRVRDDHRQALMAYVREAFPVFEAQGGCKGVLYQDAGDPERYDEVFYYASEESYQAGERAIQEDPEQVRLLERWRALLAEPPVVKVFRRLPAGE
ncbi:MAG: putative quinol monooxygenase [Candidatus Sericytochromatia bacterium]